MTLIATPLWLQASTYAANDDRALLRALVTAQGIIRSTDFAVTQNGTPNMSVNVAAGAAFVLRTGSTDFYLVEQTVGTTNNLTIAASDPTNPRRDIVVARVYDAAFSGALNQATVEVITGTPAPSPVDPTIPSNCVQLARVAVAASATSVVTGNITDLRSFYTRNTPVTAPIIFTSSGSLTAAQVAGARALKFRVQNAGAGSGGVALTTGGNCGASGGGGAGAYAERTLAVSALTFPLAVTVGAGGTAGASGANPGGVGGQSKVVDNNGGGATLCTPGVQAANQAGGAGASSTSITGAAGIGGFDSSVSGGVADLVIAGEAGGNGIRVFATIAIAARGGNAVLGMGGAVTSGTNSGSAGNLYGGGASGAVSNNAAAQAGAVGAAGAIIVELIY